MVQSIRVMMMVTLVSGLITACGRTVVKEEIAVIEVPTPVSSVEIRPAPVAEKIEVAKNTVPSKVEQLLAKLNTQSGQLTLPFDQELFDKKSKTELLPSALHDLKKIAMFLNQNPQWQVSVANYPDGIGSDYHWGLSERQANTIRFTLIQQGVASNRVIVHGLGEGRSSNRSRPIEITMIPNHSHYE